MTNKEAIQVLQRTAWLGGETYGLQNRAEQVAEAIRMAISALQELDKNPTKPNNSIEKVNNSNVTKDNSIKDCISRQAAIDALECVGYDFSESGLSGPELEEVCEAVGEVEQDMIMRIRHLPSVQPILQQSCNNLATDCINRHDAISRIQQTYMDTQEGTDRAAVNINVGLTKALHILQDIPSTQTVAKDIDVLNTDCISRRAAIDAILAVTGNSSVRELYEHVQEHGLSDMWSGGVSAAIDIIIAVPSVQPEPERTMEEFMYGQDMGNPEDGSL